MGRIFQKCSNMAANNDIFQSGDKVLDNKISQWLEWDNKQAKSYAIVQDLVAQSKWQDLHRMMMTRLKFRTAGIRGKMDIGFAYLNDLVIIQTSQGLSQYVLKCYDKPEEAKNAGCVISFDARYNSEKWAKLTARVFSKAGYRVYLFNTITPTPFVPFTVQRKKAAVGIMITASHNPKEDNGYKVFWSNGPQIKPPHDKYILQSISANLQPKEGQDSFSDDLSNFKEALVNPEEFADAYYNTLKSLLYDETMNSKFDKKIVYSAMHGVGASYIDRAFATAKFAPVVHVQEQRQPDPNFPTVDFPNPEEGKSALNLSMKTAEMNNCIYIMANDPDADRLAIAEYVENAWKIFNGNEIGTLLAWWQLQVHNKKFGDDETQNQSNLIFIASTVSSKMLGAMAKKEGLTFLETLTGFKWMANQAWDLESENETKKVLLAYEEAIGFMCGTQVLDKDGISAALRSAELMAYLNRQGLTLSQKLKELYQEYGYHCNRTSYFIINDTQITTKSFYRLRNFEGSPNTYPSELAAGKFKVVSVRDLTTGYDSSTEDKIAVFPSDPGSQMITFKFDNGVVATLRTSGTEPKLKYYCEYCARPEERDWTRIENELETLVQCLTEEFIQAEKNELICSKNGGGDKNNK